MGGVEAGAGAGAEAEAGAGACPRPWSLAHAALQLSSHYILTLLFQLTKDTGAYRELGQFVRMKLLRLTKDAIKIWKINWPIFRSYVIG